MKYRREVDGLRAVAVLPVILFHAGSRAFSGGFAGVDIFFVISGFLITSILVEEIAQGKFQLRNFYERRARRILPALFVVVLCCLPAAWHWMLPSDMKEFSESVASVFLFLSNVLFWKTSGYFDTASELKPLLHTWSLAVEEQYYVLFPVFLALLWRAGRRWVLALLVLFAAVSLAVAQWGTENNPSAAFFLLPTRGWELLLGAMIAVLLSGQAGGGERVNGWLQRRPLREFGSAAGLGLITYAIFFFDAQTPFPGVSALAPTVGAGLILLLATDQTLVGRLLGSRILVGIGLISYSAYLWHQPLFAFARVVDGNTPAPALMFGLALVSGVLATITWKYVEQPFRDRRRFGRTQIFAYASIGSLLFIAFGLVGSQTQGFSYRYEGADRELAELQTSQAGAYVARRFDSLLYKAFSADGRKKKILIVGDSYAKDLVNGLYEAGLDQVAEFSTRHIVHRCGNLYLERKLFERDLGNDATRLCRHVGLYEDARLKRLMSQADEIWFASAWQIWQADYIQRSVDNTKAEFHKPVLVFGRKNFGSFRIKDLLAIPAAQRPETRYPIDPETLEVNRRLRSHLNADDYVDIEELFCGVGARQCAMFDAHGVLLSHDGGHLTLAGAKLLGARLLERAHFAKLTAGN